MNFPSSFYRAEADHLDRDDVCRCPIDCRDCVEIDDGVWECCGGCLDDEYDDFYGDAWENSLREERDLE